MKNPIISNYRGFPIRTYNTVKLRVSQFEMKKFIDLKLDLKLSAREVLEITGRPCSRCKGVEIVVTSNKNGKEAIIKKGFLKEK